MIPGVDVSHWHPVLNWGLLSQNARFLGIKATEGNGNEDPTLGIHKAGFRASSLDLAIYYHLARLGDASAQAQRFARAVGPLGEHERLCLDVERSSGISQEYVDEFYGTLMGNGTDPLIESRPLIYASPGSWKANNLSPTWDLAASVDLWLARYAAEPGPLPAPWMPNPENPEPWQRAVIWQHTDQAVIPGVSGKCDGNFWLGTQAELTAFAD